MLKSSLHVLLFLGAFLGTAALVHRIDDLPFWSWCRPKVAHLRRHGADYDTVFVGSSRVHQAVVPAEFDRRTAELGVPTRSFNLAYAGMRPHDFSTVLDWLVAHRPPRLRRCIIELHAFEQGSRSSNWLADLDIMVHRPAGFGRRLASLWSYPLTDDSRLDRLVFLGAHSLVNALGLGRGPGLLDDLCARWRGDVPPPVADAGFTRVEEILRTEERRRQPARWRADPAAAAAALERKRQDPVPTRLRGGFDFASLRYQARLLREAGVEPIFVVMPVWSNALQGRDALDLVAVEVPLLVFDLPDAHPTLFTFDDWFDSDHLTVPGATRFSSYLAEQLVSRRLLTPQ
jgi:hypothetical protein